MISDFYKPERLAMFPADCFWGRTLSPVALPPKSSPSPPPVGALVESMDSVSVSSCESNHSEVEEGSITPMDTPDEPQKRYILNPFP